MSSSYLRTTPSVSSTTSAGQLRGAERQERGRPVERLGDSPAPSSGPPRAGDGRSATTSRASRCGASGTRARRSRTPWRRRVVDPVVQAAALERVVDLAGPVRGEDHPRRPGGLDRADLRHGDLEVGQDLEQVGLELLVGAVDLVDQEDRRGAVASASSAWSSGRWIRNSGPKMSCAVAWSASPRASSSRISSIWRG